jgi:hypothetical protein
VHFVGAIADADHAHAGECEAQAVIIAQAGGAECLDRGIGDCLAHAGGGDLDLRDLAAGALVADRVHQMRGVLC